MSITLADTGDPCRNWQLYCNALRASGETFVDRPAMFPMQLPQPSVYPEYWLDLRRRSLRHDRQTMGLIVLQVLDACGGSTAREMCLWSPFSQSQIHGGVKEAQRCAWIEPNAVRQSRHPEGLCAGRDAIEWRLTSQGRLVLRRFELTEEYARIVQPALGL
jgi:hypothetical protein